MSEFDVLFTTGQSLYFKSQYRAAVECFELMQKQACAVGSLKAESSALQGLGMAYKELGLYDDSLAKLGQSLQIQQHIGDDYGEGSSLLSIGNVYLDICQYDKALETYVKCKEKFHQIEHIRGECGASHSLGNVYHIIGEYDKAVELLENSLTFSKQLGDERLECASSQVSNTFVADHQVSSD